MACLAISNTASQLPPASLGEQIGLGEPGRLGSLDPVAPGTAALPHRPLACSPSREPFGVQWGLRRQQMSLQLEGGLGGACPGRGLGWEVGGRMRPARLGKRSPR